MAAIFIGRPLRPLPAQLVPDGASARGVWGYCSAPGTWARSSAQPAPRPPSATSTWEKRTGTLGFLKGRVVTLGQTGMSTKGSGRPGSRRGKAPSLAGPRVTATKGRIKAGCGRVTALSSGAAAARAAILLLLLLPLIFPLLLPPLLPLLLLVLLALTVEEEAAAEVAAVAAVATVSTKGSG
jgi:hypothetical protein